MKVHRLLAASMSLLLAVSTVPAPTQAHGSCAHEAVHVYGSAEPPASAATRSAATNDGAVTVWDTEAGDCDGDGVPGDFDGDLDAGIGGAALGHGPWAEWCGLHQETAGTVTVSDFVHGSNVAFVLASDDAASWVPDPVTGENTCLTDGVISPGTDLEGDDCLSEAATGTKDVDCPGGGNSIVFLLLFVLMVIVLEALEDEQAARPPTTGTVTSP